MLHLSGSGLKMVGERRVWKNRGVVNVVETATAEEQKQLEKSQRMLRQ